MNNYNAIMEELGIGMANFDLASNAWSLITGIFVYVFMAISMYSIAKRRGIHHPWLAWIPFGSSWLLGCISDQYRFVAKGQEKSKRKVMLGFDIAVASTGLVAIVLTGVALVNFFLMYGNEMVEDYSTYTTEVLTPLMIAVVLCLVMAGLAIALSVLTYMALYDLFRSCDPDRATMYLVLSIVLNLVGVGSILQGIFAFANRHKDFGMPPRENPVAYIQPVWQPPVEQWDQNNMQY